MPDERHETTPATNRHGPLPLVLGVTGHRDLRKEDEEPLKGQVRKIFRELAASYPYTPLQLISGLAEGADRLAAHVALECGVELIACLPMEKKAYLEDFPAAESRSEFEALLGRAARVIELPWAEGAATAKMGETGTATTLQGSPRNLQYQALGGYIVKHCQLLLALWDGVETKLMGGTSIVVRMQLGLQVDGWDIDPGRPLDLPETGPVYQVVTPRVKNPQPGGEPYRIRKLCHRESSTDDAGAEKYHAGVFKRMDAFNEDALKLGESLEAQRGQSKEWLLPGNARAGAAAALEDLIAHYARADALAIHFQKRTTNSMRLLFFETGLSAAFLFACFGHGPEAFQFVALALYMFAVLVGLCIYTLAERGEYKTKYLDYRALAEGLRLQIFWRLAGMTESVADYYLRKQKTDLDWIRNAVRTWNADCAAPAAAPELALVREHWVNNQCEYFKKAAAKNQHASEREKIWSQWLLGATLAIAVILMLAMACRREESRAFLSRDLFERFGRKDYKMELHGLIVMVMGMLPAVAGVMAGFSLKMAHGEQKKQYERMWKLFSRGTECLDHALAEKNDALATQTILDLGKEALEENGDWVLLHRERTVEMRIGG